MNSYEVFDVSTMHKAHIGELCKRWRILSGFTISQFAEYMDCSDGNIYKFEQGKNNNMDILLCYIANGFTVNASQLLLKKGGDDA